MSSSISTLAIDATHFALPEPTGVEVYTDALLPRLSEILLKKDIGVSWIGHAEHPPVGMPKGVHWVSSPHRRFWSQTALSALLAQTRPNLFFTPSGIPPLRSAVPTALTVHDLGVYMAPEAYSAGERLHLDFLAKRATKKAARIITPSHYVERQIEHFWKIKPEHIKVVPHGYGVVSTATQEVPELVGKKFILFIGRVEKKKNLEPVVQGFAKLVESGHDYYLVLAGKPGLGYKDLQHTIRHLPKEAQSRIILPGYVANPQRVWLYGEAQFVVAPCPIEGFGLPVLEAFAAEKPIICAQAGSLPEVAGDAALYAQADIPTDWYLQMQTAITETSRMRDLVKKGSTYLASYTWEAAATATAEALLTAL